MKPRTVAALALALAMGCAGARPGPADTLAAYATSLREGRYPEAYRMLSAETRRTLSYDDFERLAREHPEEVRETVRWLERADPSAPVTARMEMPGGEALTLVEEAGQWRLDPSVLDFYGQHTPQQTLRSFIRALEARRYDVLLRFVPRRLAEGLTAQQLRDAWEGAEADDVQEMLRQLREALSRGRAIEIAGARATMTYGRRAERVMQFVREDDGLWKIEDPE